MKAKEIETPTWTLIHHDSDKGEGENVGRMSRSLTVGSKYAKPKAAARSNGHAGDDSSEEDTDDEVYLSRHRPFEEQEVRFRCTFVLASVCVLCFRHTCTIGMHICDTCVQGRHTQMHESSMQHVHPNANALADV